MQRALALNPNLVPMWEQLASISLGHDSAQAAVAVRTLVELEGFDTQSRQWGFDASLFLRLLLSARGRLSVTLLDSLAAGVVGTTEYIPRAGFNYFLQASGFPAAQVELNRRLLALEPNGQHVGQAWQGTAFAWAARGAWDSALVAMERAAAAIPNEGSAVGVYAFAVTGAWLGGVDTARAAARRAAAVTYLRRLPRDSALTKRRAAGIAWADGMLAVVRRDTRALATARAAVRQSGSEQAEFLDRSLAGFETELKGERGLAADSLAALDLAATVAELWAPRDAQARSIDHLMASRLLLQEGDTSRAVQLLTWHEGDLGYTPNAVAFQVFAPLAYYELARIEEAQGRNDQARDHYQQFLRRYDMPPPAHQHLVDEAKASLRKLNGLNDAPATR